jgi:hypothetical protein
MQVKTVTVFAASLALAQASKFDLNRRNDTVAYWGDENVKPTTTKPTSPEETTTTHWSDVDIKTTTTTKPVSPETSSTTTWGDWTSSTTSSKPVSPETSTSSYVYWVRAAHPRSRKVSTINYDAKHRLLTLLRNPPHSSAI